jgi:preprotein translocase subunit SecG
MGYIIGLMTVILAVTCFFLILLILMQLPKKEAGMGTAFGGSATDALFGAGTGNVLTKATRYAATVFFVLAMTLSFINANRSKQGSQVRDAVVGPEATATPRAPSPATAPTNLLSQMAHPVSTSLISAIITNQATNIGASLGLSLPGTNPITPNLTATPALLLEDVMKSAGTNLPSPTPTNLDASKPGPSPTTATNL